MQEGLGNFCLLQIETSPGFNQIYKMPMLVALALGTALNKGLQHWPRVKAQFELCVCLAIQVLHTEKIIDYQLKAYVVGWHC